MYAHDEGYGLNTCVALKCLVSILLIVVSGPQLAVVLGTVSRSNACINAVSVACGHQEIGCRSGFFRFDRSLIFFTFSLDSFVTNHVITFGQVGAVPCNPNTQSIWTMITSSTKKLQVKLKTLPSRSM
jgi:hypothetical protein